MDKPPLPNQLGGYPKHRKSASVPVCSYMLLWLQCLLHTWFLANDMHFHLMSLIVIIPLLKSKRLGLTVNAILLSSSILLTAVINYVNDYPPAMLYTQPEIEYALICSSMPRAINNFLLPVIPQRKMGSEFRFLLETLDSHWTLLHRPGSWIPNGHDSGPSPASEDPTGWMVCLPTRSVQCAVWCLLLELGVGDKCLCKCTLLLDPSDGLVDRAVLDRVRMHHGTGRIYK